jgi:hypothetical protein
MLSELFEGIFYAEETSIIGVGDFLLCLFFALLLGGILAVSYIYKSKYTKSFVVTLAIIPSVVAMIIMMVNGNIGAGVAVAGAFSLIRFRSVPGTAKEIGAIFIGMAAGLAIGMGYVAYAGLFTIILSTIMFIYARSKFGESKELECGKTIRITIPEDLDYTDIFKDIFEKYTKENTLSQVKTTNMGSMFRLTYQVMLKDITNEKEMIDEIRCRNGNLEITMSNLAIDNDVL